MKKTIISLIVGIFFFSFACKDSSTQPTNESDLVGTWLLKQQTGGFAGQTYYPPEGTTFLLQVTDDNRFVESRNDTVTFSDRFIVHIDSVENVQLIDFIDSKRTSVFVQKVTSDSLTLWDGMMDGFFSFYIREK